LEKEFILFDENESIADISTVMASHLNRIGFDQERAKLISKDAIENSVKIFHADGFQDSLQLVTMLGDGREGAKSVKSGNLIINVKKLMVAVSITVPSLYGVSVNPFLAPFVFCSLFFSFIDVLKVELREVDAVVLYSLWAGKGSGRLSPNLGLLERCNKHFEKYGRPNISERDLSHALSRLEKFRCIVKSDAKIDHWFLAERISIKFRY